MLEEKVTAPDKTAAPAEFEPKIVAFCCNWCSYAGADGAGTARKQYPANVKIIRVPCSWRRWWRYWQIRAGDRTRWSSPAGTLDSRCRPHWRGKQMSETPASPQGQTAPSQAVVARPLTPPPTAPADL